jgi:hypothetical protein
MEPNGGSCLMSVGGLPCMQQHGPWPWFCTPSFRKPEPLLLLLLMTFIRMRRTSMS